MEENNQLAEIDKICTAIYNLQIWIGKESNEDMVKAAMDLLTKLDNLTEDKPNTNQALLKKMTDFLREKGISISPREVKEQNHLNRLTRLARLAS